MIISWPSNIWLYTIYTVIYVRAIRYIIYINVVVCTSICNWMCSSSEHPFFTVCFAIPVHNNYELQSSHIARLFATEVWLWFVQGRVTVFRLFGRLWLATYIPSSVITDGSEGVYNRSVRICTSDHLILHRYTSIIVHMRLSIWHTAYTVRVSYCHICMHSYICVHVAHMHIICICLINECSAVCIIMILSV